MMGSSSLSLDDALRAAIRAELNVLFEDKIKPLLEARGRSVEASYSAPSEFLSTADAAKKIGVSVATVQAWIRQQKLVGHKAGRLLRVRVHDLERFMTPATTEDDFDLEAEAKRMLSGEPRRRAKR